MLQAAGFEAEADPKFNWLIDTFPMLLRMFPDRCPPVTIISQNSHYDPYFHVEIGRTLRPLRKEGYLFIGSGGGVHNLYRVDWSGMLLWRDNWAQRAPPSGGHLDFRQALEDVICKNGGGPDLKRAIVRLIKHPYYRVAHGTDEHFLPFCFVAGVVGEEEDRGEKGVLACEVWELVRIGSPDLTFDLVTASDADESVGTTSRDSVLHRKLANSRLCSSIVVALRMSVLN